MPNFDVFLQGLEWASAGSGPDKIDGKPAFEVAHRRHPGDRDLIANGNLGQVIEFTERARPSAAAPLFVSYYTAGTPYEALAMQLKRSLDRFGLEHRIEPIQSLGSWVANTGLKASFIERAWAESERPICWVDADAELLRAPHFLYDNPFDFAVVRRHGWYFISSVVYLGKSPAVGRLVARWAQLCRQHPNIWDQVLLTLAWHEIVREEAFASLFLPDGIFRFPRPYVRDLRDQIFYYPLGLKMRPFFDQKQASRAHKRFMDAGGRRENELGSDDLSQMAMKALATYDFDTALSVDNFFKA